MKRFIPNASRNRRQTVHPIPLAMKLLCIHTVFRNRTTTMLDNTYRPHRRRT